jgi:hypothetical protein
MASFLVKLLPQLTKAVAKEEIPAAERRTNGARGRTTRSRSTSASRPKRSTAASRPKRSTTTTRSTASPRSTARVSARRSTTRVSAAPKPAATPSRRRATAAAKS